VAHRALIAGAVMRARELGVKAAVVSFDPHPDTVVRPDFPMIYLTSLEDKARLIAELGTDYLIIQPFTQEFRSLASEAFVDWLLNPAEILEIHIGEDFVFGHKAKGNAALLYEMGKSRGFHVHSLAPLEVDNAVVSSTRIRNLLLEGQAAQAARLLTRYHTVRGIVVKGAQRGRLLGFPTANIEVAPDFAIPGNGIYATIATIEAEGEWKPRLSATSIGVRPTFDNGPRSIETFILDFDGDLYGKYLQVEFVAKLRDEEKFSSVEALITQMNLDVEKARQILGKI
jgi:riboflavin kinase/FMN adenylyltransferase